MKIKLRLKNRRKINGYVAFMLTQLQCAFYIYRVLFRETMYSTKSKESVHIQTNNQTNKKRGRTQ